MVLVKKDLELIQQIIQNEVKASEQHLFGEITSPKESLLSEIASTEEYLRNEMILLATSLEEKMKQEIKDLAGMIRREFERIYLWLEDLSYRSELVEQLLA